MANTHKNLPHQPLQLSKRVSIFYSSSPKQSSNCSSINQNPLILYYIFSLFSLSFGPLSTLHQLSSGANRPQSILAIDHTFKWCHHARDLQGWVWFWVKSWFLIDCGCFASEIVGFVGDSKVLSFVGLWVTVRLVWFVNFDWFVAPMVWSLICHRGFGGLWVDFWLVCDWFLVDQ